MARAKKQSGPTGPLAPINSASYGAVNICSPQVPAAAAQRRYFGENITQADADIMEAKWKLCLSLVQPAVQAIG